MTKTQWAEIGLAGLLGAVGAAIGILVLMYSANAHSVSGAIPAPIFDARGSCICRQATPWCRCKVNRDPAPEIPNGPVEGNLCIWEKWHCCYGGIRKWCYD
jgi:hypothetical protein